ncbi:MAG: biopolymer transporter ExbD [Thermodesulfobacteriota bacterium]
MAGKKLISQINVTPLVDVMLVLLVIFMITAPMMESGIDVNLPKAEGGQLKADEEPVVLTINRDGKIFLGSVAVIENELSGKLEAIFKRRSQKVVFLRADESVPYGSVARAMSLVRRSGIERIAMVTEGTAANGDRTPK